MTLFFDPILAGLVFVGTGLCVVLRRGLAETRIAMSEVGALLRPRFDSRRVRSELAIQLREIDQDGLLRAVPHHVGDGEFDELTETLVRRRSLKAMLREHQRHRARRQAHAVTATRFLLDAADMGPVIGLAGTLWSLGGMVRASGSFGGNGLAVAIATTFDGLIVANFLCAPLANAVERRAQAEERSRKHVLDWLSAGLERSMGAEGDRLDRAVRG